MKRRNQDFALGLTVLALVALLLGSIFFITGSSLLGPQTQNIEVHFTLDEGLAPLKVGSPVTLRGAIQIGEVTGVEIKTAGDDPNRPEPVIVVNAQIRDDVDLYADCRITTNQPVIGGGGFLNIYDVGEADAGPVTAPFINGQRPQSLQAAIEDLSDWLLGRGGFLEKLDVMIDPQAEDSIMYKVASALDDINAITETLKEQMDPSKQSVLLGKIHAIADRVADTTAAIRDEMKRESPDATLARVHDLLALLEDGLGEARDLVRENRPPVRRALASVAAAAETVERDMLPAVADEFDRENAEALLSKIHAGLDRANASLANVQTATETGKRMLVVNRPALDRTVANIKEASEQLKAGIIEIRLQPWRFMSPPTQEKEQIAVFEAARLFAEAARRLDDTAARLEALAEIVPAGERTIDDQAEIKALEAALQAAFEKFQAAEQHLWDTMK